MMASRALLVKQTAALLLRQPVCLTHHAADWGNANIAVVFSGCGWWDGTDVHEAAYTMYHLSRNGARFQIFAPNQQQQQVMDHARMQPSSGESRNTLSESARFSHGHGPVQVNDLAKLDANSFDGVIFPGGHGVVKNLSSFSKDGKDCKLNADVERILKEFHRARKPIGLASTAPLLACRALPGLEVTMGSEREEGGRWGRWTNTSMVQALKNMGARHSSREPYISFTDTGHEVNVDEKNKVVSTPSFMWETDYHYHYIFDGIGNMVKHVMRMTSK